MHCRRIHNSGRDGRERFAGWLQKAACSHRCLGPYFRQLTSEANNSESNENPATWPRCGRRLHGGGRTPDRWAMCRCSPLIRYCARRPTCDRVHEAGVPNNCETCFQKRRYRSMEMRRFFPADKTLRSCRRRLKLYADYGLTQQLFTRFTATSRNGCLPTIHRLTKKVPMFCKWRPVSALSDLPAPIPRS